MAYSRVDEYGRRVDPLKDSVPLIPNNRKNEGRPSVEVWQAPPLRKAENPRLHDAVNMADELASVHLFLDQQKAVGVNDGDPSIHIHQHQQPSVVMPGGSESKFPIPNAPFNERQIRNMSPNDVQHFKGVMDTRLNPTFLT
jgi:hypothetical protein